MKLINIAAKSDNNTNTTGHPDRCPDRAAIAGRRLLAAW